MFPSAYEGNYLSMPGGTPETGTLRTLRGLFSVRTDLKGSRGSIGFAQHSFDAPIKKRQRERHRRVSRYSFDYIAGPTPKFCDDRRTRQIPPINSTISSSLPCDL